MGAGVAYRPSRSAAATLQCRNRQGRQIWLAAGDAFFAFVIVGAGVVALSPRTGIAAAREAIAARRARRAAINRVGQTCGEIWARQARRNALALARSAPFRHRPPIDP